MSNPQQGHTKNHSHLSSPDSHQSSTKPTLCGTEYLNEWLHHFFSGSRPRHGTPHQNTKSECWGEAWANSELGVMLKLIGKLKVFHLVFCHNSHNQVREAPHVQM